MKKSLATALLLVSTLSGCIGTDSNVMRPNAGAAGARYWYKVDNPGGMTPEGLSILQNQLDRRLVAVRAAESDPTALRADVHITSYRMRHGAARALVGVMAGTDHIRSLVVIVEPKSGKEIGRAYVESKNQTAIGSAGGLIEGHANEIADFILSGKASATVIDPNAPAASTQPAKGEMKWKPRRSL